MEDETTMRNDHEAAQPPGQPAKRGRGRPRKADALSNAQRQAAWRARRRAAGNAAGKSVTVTENPLAAECERLRAELRQARHPLEAISPAAPSGRAAAEISGVLQRSTRIEVRDPEAGARSLRLTIYNPTLFALERLVSHFGLSRAAIIERLVDWVDEAVTRSFGDDDEAFNRYIDRRNEKG
jgi:hypothetical protein